MVKNAVRNLEKKLFQLFTVSVLKVNQQIPFLGEDIVVGVSGGIDSLSLYSFLKEYYAARKFKGKVYGVNVSVGKGKVKPLDFPGVINIPPAPYSDGDLNCSLCARLRKMAIFKFCEERNIKYVAFAHIADDFAESLLWNMIYHKRLESMAIVRNYFNGKFFVLRPFAFVGKKDIEKWAKLKGINDLEHKCEIENFVRDDVRKFLVSLEEKGVLAYRNLLDLIEKNGFWGE